MSQLIIVIEETINRSCSFVTEVFLSLNLKARQVCDVCFTDASKARKSTRAPFCEVYMYETKKLAPLGSKTTTNKQIHTTTAKNPRLIDSVEHSCGRLTGYEAIYADEFRN